MTDYTTISLDTYWLDDEGIFDNIQTDMPTGKLAPGLETDPVSLVSRDDFHNIPIFSILEEGSGSVAANLGSLNDGTITRGTWAQYADGTWYLRNPTITYADPLTVAEWAEFLSPDEDSSVESPLLGYVERTKTSTIAFGIFHIRNISSGTLCQKDVFRCWIDTSKNIYISAWGHTFKVAPHSQELSILNVQNRWMNFGFLVDGTWEYEEYAEGAVRLSNIFYEAKILINGAKIPMTLISSGTAAASATPQPLIIGNNSAGTDPLTADLSWFFYSALSTSPLGVADSIEVGSGTWTSPIIDLGDTYSFDRVTHDGFLNEDHNAHITIRLAATADMYKPKITTARLDELHQDYTDKSFYPERMVYGRYLQVIVNVRRDKVSQLLPHLKTVQLRMRAA